MRCRYKRDRGVKVQPNNEVVGNYNFRYFQTCGREARQGGRTQGAIR